MKSSIETSRLVLRHWKSSDLPALASLNSDPRVMEFFPSPLSVDESREMLGILQNKIREHGFGFWAAEFKETHECIGFIGLNIPGYPVPFSPCVEIGWRLAFPYWGKGLATEGAIASLRFGFDDLQLKEIVSFTATQNLRSRKVMETIGMQRDENGDFDHAKIASDHPLCRHVLYRISKENFEKEKDQ